MGLGDSVTSTDIAGCPALHFFDASMRDGSAARGLFEPQAFVLSPAPLHSKALEESVLRKSSEDGALTWQGARCIRGLRRLVFTGRTTSQKIASITSTEYADLRIADA